MSDESIELYKPYTPDKMVWPAMIQEKLDGVPVRIRKLGGSHVHAYSRQNEVITSISHLVPVVGRILMDRGSITGELHIRGLPFKTIGGLVRKKVPVKECGDLVLNVFDFDQRGEPALSWEARRLTFQKSLEALERAAGRTAEDMKIRMVPGVVVYGPEDAEAAFKLIMQCNPNAEGAVLHSLTKDFVPGKRRWLTQKMKPEPTIDLLVVGFEEAVSLATGNPLGMVGRINVELSTLKGGKLNTDLTGAGPGALTHAERKVLWAKYCQGKFTPQIAEFKYMIDDTYDGIRQGTFVRWRDDKRVADIRNK